MLSLINLLALFLFLERWINYAMSSKSFWFLWKRNNKTLFLKIYLYPIVQPITRSLCGNDNRTKSVSINIFRFYSVQTHYHHITYYHSGPCHMQKVCTVFCYAFYLIRNTLKPPHVTRWQCNSTWTRVTSREVIVMCLHF